MKNISLDKFKILSGSMLKLIAVISMLIDHFAHIFVNDLDFMKISLASVGGQSITVYYIMRAIGRLAFPIFCFLIAEGFVHTKNTKKYALRLLIFAAVSEIPFNLMLSGSLIDPLHQNVFFTLFLGVILIYIFKNIKSELKKAVLMLAIVVIALLLKADYGLMGVLLIFMIYALKTHPAAQAVLSLGLLYGKSAYYAAFAAFIPINMYNGERGFIKSKALKYGFYIFYPLHILVLIAIKYIIITSGISGA